MVVLPTPGGPHKIMEGIFPFSMDVRKILPLPVRCSCPVSASKLAGRKRSDKGGRFMYQSYIRMFTTGRRVLEKEGYLPWLRFAGCHPGLLQWHTHMGRPLLKQHLLIFAGRFQEVYRLIHPRSL